VTMRTLLSLYAMIAVVFCLGLCVMPVFWITLYGAHADPQAILLLRLVGALFGGPAVMTWKARNAERSKSRDAIVLGLIFFNGLGAFAALLGALSGVYNQFAWGPVATFTLCAIAFLLVGREAISSSTPN